MNWSCNTRLAFENLEGQGQKLASLGVDSGEIMMMSLYSAAAIRVPHKLNAFEANLTT